MSPMLSKVDDAAMASTRRLDFVKIDGNEYVAITKGGSSNEQKRPESMMFSNETPKKEFHPSGDDKQVISLSGMIGERKAP